jgi:putative hydrolase of the HAD superfamily
VALGKSLLSLPALPLPGVPATLRALRAKQRYKLVVFSKGETLDQRSNWNGRGLTHV